MMYNAAFFDAGLDRRGTRTAKWQGSPVQGEGALPMWVADMDFECAKEIKDALLARAAHGNYGYTITMDDDSTSLLSFLLRRHSVRASAEDIVFLPCVVSGLRACVRTLTKPGDHIAMLTPVYGPFYSSVRDAGRVVDACPLVRDEHGAWQVDFDRIEATLKMGAKLFMLCNPHNPLSRAFTMEELSALCALCTRYDCRVVSDEIHMDFIYAPRTFVSVWRIPEAQNAICLCAPSKTFNLAGLEHAALITRDAGARKALEHDLDINGVTCCNIFGLEAARAAYLYGDAWLDGLKQYLKDGASLLQTLLTEQLPQAVLAPIEATYLAFIDLRAYAPTTETLLAACRAQALELSSGTFFGPEGEGYVRLNFGCPHSSVREGVKRLEAAMKSLSR